MSVQVVGVPERQRFEGVLSLEEPGVRGALVRDALDHVRGLGLRVLPICAFVQAWMLRHPEHTDPDHRRPSSKVTD